MQAMDRNTDIALFWPNSRAKFLMRILSQQLRWTQIWPWTLVGLASG